jgi:hypothetical protein
LSFSNNSKSFGQKSLKKRKQDFHRHKVKLHQQEEGELTGNFPVLKERTMIALLRLGEQRFSQEPGGYGFQNWMKNFNLLLDDFETQAGQGNLPKEYFAKRLELTASLVKAGNSNFGPDQEILKLKDEQQTLLAKITEARAVEKMKEERHQREERISSLEADKSIYLERLKETQGELARKKKELENSKKVLNRIFGGSKRVGPSSIRNLEEKIDDIRSKIEILDKKILEQRSDVNSSSAEKLFEANSGSADLDQLQDSLDSVNSQLAELEIENSERSEFIDDRRRITSQMREMISAIEIRAASKSTV